MMRAAFLVLCLLVPAGLPSAESAQRHRTAEPGTSMSQDSEIVGALRQAEREKLGQPVEVRPEGMTRSDYRVRLVTEEEQFVDAVVDLTPPGRVDIQREGLIERLLNRPTAHNLWQAFRFSRTLAAAITLAEKETGGTATAARAELDQDERVRFLVEVRDDGVTRTVIIGDFFQKILGVNPPDSDARR